MVGSRLNKSNLSRFMRACHPVFRACTPGFFKDVDVIFDSEEQEPSLEILKPVVDNAHNIRAIRMDADFLELYFNETARACHSPETRDAGAGTQPMAAGCQSTSTTLSPSLSMVHLTSIDFSAPFVSVWAQPTQPSDLHDSGVYFEQLCRIITSNPRLTSITLKNFGFKDEQEFRLLASTISSLDKLENLKVDVMWFSLPADIFFPSLLFGCPSSLKSAVFSQPIVGPARANTAAATTTTSSQELLRRSASLQHLTKLYWDSEIPTRANTVISVLAHCPHLVIFSPPAIEKSNDLNQFAKSVVKHCPSLCDLGNPDSMFAIAKPYQRRHCDRFLHAALARGSPWTWFSEDTTSPSQESSSGNARPSPFEAVGEDLAETQADLHDLCAKVWASTSIQVLRLAIIVGDWNNKRFEVGDDDFDERGPDFDFVNPSPARVDRELGELIEPFATLYQQIGAQTMLRILELMIASAPETLYQGPTFSFENYIFPDFLSLGEKLPSGRRGWGGLAYFSNLSKLEELRGSFCVDMIEAP
ncbi:hypothetical protein BGX29_003249, partial [Mortierella sp. GBA35]